MTTINELFDLTAYEQGEKLFNASNDSITEQLMRFWPDHTPQKKLFFKIYTSKPNYENYETLVSDALYEVAKNMAKESRDTIKRITNKDSSELMANCMRDILGLKKVTKKEDVDNVQFCGSTLNTAAECYDKITAGAMPRLKIQKIRFKGAEKVDNIHVDMLANSILAHNLIFNTHQVIKNDDLRVLSESAESMLSYIAEAYDVSIRDIIEDYTDKLALSADNGNITMVPFWDILELYDEL